VGAGLHAFDDPTARQRGRYGDSALRAERRRSDRPDPRASRAVAGGASIPRTV